MKDNFVKELEKKHMIMLSLGGVIGTGIFLSTGYLIQSAGAVGTILAYAIGAVLVCLVMLCLGELTVHEPNTGAFHTYAAKYIHPGVGFVVAWLYWLTWTVALGSQFITLGLLCQHWFPTIPTWIWALFFAVLTLALNVINLKIFSTSEFWMSLIKVVAIVAFLIIGFAGVFGFVPYGNTGVAPYFSEFTKNGLFPEGIGAVLLVVLSANFAFSGTELISVAAGESDNPRRDVPKAIVQTLITLIVLFIGTIIVLGALLPQETAGLSESPFVTVLQNFGIPYVADVMNFILIVTVLSGANSGLYAASRMLWSLADKGTLPHQFAKLSKNGLPIYGLLFTTLGGFLSLFSSVYAPETVYLALVSISGFAVVAVWLIIGWAQLNFRRHYLKNGGQLSELGFVTPWYPVVPWAVIILCLVSIVGIFFDPNQRIAIYIGLPFSILCFLYYQFFFKGKGELHAESYELTNSRS